MGWSSCENCTIADDYDESVDNVISANCKEDMQCELKTAIPILKMFVTLTLEVSYAPIVTMINVINGKIFTLV